MTNYPDGSYEKAIAEAMDMAGPGDTLLCCMHDAIDCPRYEAGQCDCKLVPLDGSMSVEQIKHAMLGTRN